MGQMLLLCIESRADVRCLPECITYSGAKVTVGPPELGVNDAGLWRNFHEISSMKKGS